MGDVLTLIEKAGAEMDEDKARKMADKMKKAQFDFEDYLESMEQMRKMGGLSSIRTRAGTGRSWGRQDAGSRLLKKMRRNGKDGSHDLLYDSGREAQPRSSESVEKAPHRKRRPG